MSWCHLIEADGGIVLVDAGSPRKEGVIMERLRGLGRDDLKLIFITHAHFDHYGSAAALRRLTGAPIAIHSADRDAMAGGETPLGKVRLWGRVIKLILPLAERRIRPEPTTADVIVEEGDRLAPYGIDAEVLHTPGHTHGSCSLIVDGRLAFVSDLVSQVGWPHAQLVYAQDWDELGTSLRRVQQLEPEWVYTGHGGRPIPRNVFLKIKARV
jgi:hydroxyacylglutathione hydrolase